MQGAYASSERERFDLLLEDVSIRNESVIRTMRALLLRDVPCRHL
jgi:hypothetical protein